MSGSGRSTWSGSGNADMAEAQPVSFGLEVRTLWRWAPTTSERHVATANGDLTGPRRHPDRGRSRGGLAHAQVGQQLLGGYEHLGVVDDFADGAVGTDQREAV